MTQYSFKSKIWKYKGKGAWFFLNLPKVLSKKIRKKYGIAEEGWGRLPTHAKIGVTKWRTAIWYDSKFDCYLLPIKKEIRTKEKLSEEIMIKVSLFLNDDELKLIKRFIA